MNNSGKYTYFFILLRIILGGIFIYAAIGKIADPHEFSVNIRNYELLPVALTHIPALTLPWLELICGVLLIFGIWEKSSAVLISGMMVLFIIAISNAMARGLDIDCGCYKSIAESGKVGWQRLAEDVIFLAMGLMLIFREKSEAMIDRLF